MTQPMHATDATLLQRWRDHGDPQAFRALVDAYANLVYAAALRILNNPADAEDVTQESFLALAQHPRADRSLAAWLHRVATNKSINLHRTRARRQRREHTWTQEQPPMHTPTWDDIREHLDAAINDLPETDRALLIGHYLQGQTHEQLAQSLGLTRTAVTKRISRTVDKLRDQLKKRGVPIAAPALTAMLVTNTSEAAPAGVLTKLAENGLLGPLNSGVGLAKLKEMNGGATAMKTALLSLVGLVTVTTVVWWYGFDAVDDGPNSEPERFEAPQQMSEIGPAGQRGTLTTPAIAENIESTEPPASSTESVSDLEGVVHDVETGVGVPNISVHYTRIPAGSEPQINYTPGPQPRLAMIFSNVEEVPSDIEIQQFSQISYRGDDGHPVKSLIGTFKTTRIGESGHTGEFVLEDLEPGYYAVVAGSENGYWASNFETVQISTDETTSIRIAVASVATLTGTITQAGEPIGESVLSIDAIPEGHWSIRTDPDGTYRLEGVRPQDGHFRAFLNLPSGARLASRMTHLKIRGGETLVHDFEFGGGSAALTGRIYRQSDDSAVSGHVILDWQYLVDDGNDTDRVSLRAPIGPDGVFRLTDLQDGPAIISVFPEDIDGTLRFARLVELEPNIEQVADFPVWDTAIQFEVENIPEEAQVRVVFVVEGDYFIPRRFASFKELVDLEAYLVAVAFIESGQAKISGLPPGHYTVGASALPTGVHFQQIAAMGQEFFEKAQCITSVVDITEKSPDVEVALNFAE